MPILVPPLGGGTGHRGFVILSGVKNIIFRFGKFRLKGGGKGAVVAAKCFKIK